MSSHIVLPDTQVKPGVDIAHLKKVAKYIVKHKPDTLVMLGDHWDFPSLSSYATTKQAENKRLMEDVSAGNEAMDALMKPIRRAMKTGVWNPNLIFCIGNHENRLTRIEQTQPTLENYFQYDMLNLKDWDVYDFLQIKEVDGIHYSHYFVNPFSGRPYGGQITNILNKLKFSFIQGHKQTLEFAMTPLNNGKVINGIVCGAFYTHDEDYKGYQGNNHFRGFLHLHNVNEGNFDLETISINRLMRMKL